MSDMIDPFLIQNGLKNEDLMAFKEALLPSHHEKGDHFIRRGQTSRYIALVESGYLRTYHLDEEAREVTTEFNGPNSFCGSYYSFYTQTPAFESIEAISDCVLWLLPYNSLQKLYAQRIAVNAFGRTILEKACIERDLRLKKVMHLSALEKYQWFLEGYPDLFPVAKLGWIASFLGMQQETLSRVRRRMLP